MANPVLMAALAIAIAFAETAAAQNPPPPPTRGGGAAGTTGSGAAAQPARGGGGQRGGGRGMRQMTLSSSAWPDGGNIPVKYSQAGADISPPLTWSAAPEGTVGFVLLVHDLNVPDGGENRLHWLVWNIPATATSLPEGVPAGAELPDGMRQTSRTGPYYRGAAAAPTDAPHHYMFELFAVDTIIDVKAYSCTMDERCLSSPAPATRTAIMAAMVGHVRGKAVMFGLYQHPK